MQDVDSTDDGLSLTYGRKLPVLFITPAGLAAPDPLGSSVNMHFLPGCLSCLVFLQPQRLKQEEEGS